MQLCKLDIKNFLRIADIQLDFSQAQVYLLAGRNEAGKSSILEAMRFLLQGDSPRVRKGDRNLLLRAGAKKGKVTAVFDTGEFARNIRDGKLSGDMPASLAKIPALVIELALGIRRFGELADTERRQFLFELLNISFHPDVIMRRLEKRGFPDALLERVSPLLRSGFDTVVPEADRKISELRGQWEGITGERYGSKKAEDWQPAVMDGSTDANEIETIKGDIQRLEAELSEQNQLIGKAQATIEHLERARVTLTALNERIGYAENAENSVGVLQTKLTLIYDSLPGELLAQLPCPCPECGVELYPVLENGTTVLKHAAEIDTENLADLRSLATKLAKDIALLEKAAAELPQLRARHEETTGILQQGEPNTVELGKERDRIQDYLKARRLELERAQSHFVDQGEVEKQRKRAANAHAAIQGWTEIRAAMSPEGIPGEILAEGMGPFNADLRQTADAADWEPVQLSDDLHILRGAMPYALLSESARWRADAMLAALIAERAGLNFLMLDRLDVLDVPNRYRFLQWADSLRDRLACIVACGTFKEPPSVSKHLPVQVHWLEAGRID